MVIGTSKSFTTIQSDVRDGLYAALKELESQTGRLNYDEKLACSSAGGGLKMIAVGLVPELTTKAAKMAAASAGAKVTNVFSYELSSCEQEEIHHSNPDILLLCGGTDGGNKKTIIHNAKKIAEIENDFTIIYAGNKCAADEAAAILQNAGKNVVICKNVMPVFNALDIAPAKEIIRKLFIEKIIDAKGLSKIQKEMTREIIPTPLAVFDGAELFSRGCNGIEGMGELIAVDLGGATTDVYSMCNGKPARPNVVIKGLPEPFAKRSVEGDLGLRYNIDSLAESAGLEKAAIQLQTTTDLLREWVNVCKKNPEVISEPGSANRKFDDYLSCHAITLAVERHCGTSETVYTPMGETRLMSGKDLTNVPTIIGIGGPVINSDNAAKILSGAVYNQSNYDPSRLEYLKPAKPKFYLDKKYIFASMGLVSKIDSELAFEIMKDDISEIQGS